MPTSLIAPVVGAGVSFGLSKAFGGGSSSKNPTAPLQNFQPTGFRGGGFGTSFGQGGLTIAPTAERLGLVGGLRDTFGQLAGELGGQRARVAPGISELRASRLGEVENARTAAIGNLRENLARRRVLGSSFGQDALTRAESEFAGQKERVAAESFLQEFELTNQLINQQFNAQRQQFQVGLDQLNLEADIATKLAAGATKTMGDNAQFLAALNAKEASEAGKFFGQTFAPVGKAIGEGVGKLDFGRFFEPGASGSPAGTPVQA